MSRNDLKEKRKLFCKMFQDLSHDFLLKGMVEINYSIKYKDTLEIYYSVAREDHRLYHWMKVTMFTKSAYQNLKRLNTQRIVLIDEVKNEFEDLSIDELKKIIENG